MNVSIYYRTRLRPWGGTNSFIRSLKKELSKKGVRIAYKPSKRSSVMLVNGAYRAPGKMVDAGFIADVREKCGIKIILRLDGLRSHYNPFDKSGMDDLQMNLVDIADYIVFQSNFSLNLFKLAGYSKNNYTVIYNGVDNSVFNPLGSAEWDGHSKLNLIYASWSANRLKCHREVAEVSLLDNLNVVFVGNWPKGLDRKNVSVIPPKSHKKLAWFLKSAHIFFFPSENESCPNILLEAVSCGLPVLYKDSGANSEIAKGFGVSYEDDFVSGLREITCDYKRYRKYVLSNYTEFSISGTAGKYIEIFGKVGGESL